MEDHILKSHNKTLLLYHLVFPVKYRREIFTESVSESLKRICLAISARYEIHFVEIGMEENHVHFLVQGVPSMSVTQIVMTIKSITARRIFLLHKEVKIRLWGGNLWTSGYYANTVGQYGNMEAIQRYIANQGSYKKLLEQQPLLDLGFQ